MDQDGEVLDIFVQPRRNKQAVKKFFLKLLNILRYVPRFIVTDKLHKTQKHLVDNAMKQMQLIHRTDRNKAIGLVKVAATRNKEIAIYISKKVMLTR